MNTVVLHRNVVVKHKILKFNLVLFLILYVFYWSNFYLHPFTDHVTTWLVSTVRTDSHVIYILYILHTCSKKELMLNCH